MDSDSKIKLQKVIFLDIDGVLCTNRSHQAFSSVNGLMQHLDPTACGLISRLSIETQAKIVISSTWRRFHERESMYAILLNGGFSELHLHEDWCTPMKLSYRPRGEEIQHWLDSQKQKEGAPEIERYVIIDDDSDMLESQSPFFVQTESCDGFLWKHYVLARNLLVPSGTMNPKYERDWP